MLADTNAYRFLFTLSPREHIEEMLRNMDKDERVYFLLLVDSFKTINSFGQYHAVDEKILPFHKDSCLEKLRNSTIIPFLTQFPEYVQAEARYRSESLSSPEKTKLGVASLRALVKVGEALYEIAQGIDILWKYGYMDTPVSVLPTETGKIEAISQEENTSVSVGKTDTGKMITLSQEVRPQGVYIIGNNGTGKSALIENLIVSDLEQGIGICLLDPYGDLTKNIIARCPENRVEDIIHLNLMNTSFSFGLNLFECPDPTDINQFELAASIVTHVFAKIWGVGYGSPHVAQVLRNVTHTFIKNSHLGITFAEIPLLFSDETLREKLVLQVTNPSVRAFWQQYNKMPYDQQIEYADPILSRVGEFLDRQSVTNIVGQSKTTINFSEIMDNGKVLLVQLSPKIEDISSLIGCVFIGKLLHAAYARQAQPEQDRRRFHIYADEFQRFASEDFGTLINEACKFNLGLCFAHQTTVQISETVKQSAFSSGTKIIFRVTGEDAKELAKVFDRTPQGQVQIGEEPVLAPTTDPLGFIVKNSHTDKAVIELVDAVRREMDYIDHSKPDPVMSNWGNIKGEVIGRYGIESQATLDSHERTYHRGLQEMEKLNKQIHENLLMEIRAALNTLNSWLYEVMKTGRVGSLPASCDKLTEVTKALVLPAAQCLAKNPILVSTGQYKPKYQQRTFADMEKEISSTLANMPNRRARVKILDNEFEIATLPPSLGLTGQALSDRLSSVQQQTISSVCVARSAVEQEIVSRQENL